MKIKTLVVVRTPFHLAAITRLFPEIISGEQTLVLYNEHVDPKKIYTKAFQVKNYNFSQRKIFKTPWKYYRQIQKDLQEIKDTTAFLVNKYNLDNTEVYIGSDKDVFTQVLVSRLGARMSSLTAVDEGFGFYVNIRLKDRFIGWIYGLLTPLVLGVRLYYIKRMGTLPKIDTIYLRNVDLLADKRTDVKYIEFELDKNHQPTELKTGSVLFYTFPEQDLGYDPKDKIEVIREFSNYLNKQGKKLLIKPHPRENAVALKAGLGSMPNIEILDGKLLGEELNYFNYEYIVNVFSSVLLDILAHEYPTERIVTLGFTARIPVMFDIPLAYYHFENFDYEKAVTFEA